MRDDYYQLLDVRECATSMEIKAAYRRQAILYHPDHNVGNPAAEERFKLVAEAYRTLGDIGRRADYDSWLERRKRLMWAPELASMPRKARLSPRHAHERREARRYRRDASRPMRPRPFLMRPSSKWSMTRYLVLYILSLFLLAPWFTVYMNHGKTSAPAHESRAGEPGVSPLDDATQERNLAEFTERIRQAALSGNPEAQCRLGSFLFHGMGGLEQDRQAALEWWMKAAEQGYAPAQQYLKKSRELLAAPSPERKPAPSPSHGE